VVRERFPQIPVLLTTGYAKALMGAHSLPILRKPYQISALADAVRKALAGAVGTERQASLL
jgi:hypothetical protein